MLSRGERKKKVQMLNRGAGRKKMAPRLCTCTLVFLAGRRGCALPPFCPRRAAATSSLQTATHRDRRAGHCRGERGRQQEWTPTPLEIPSALCAPNGRHPTPARFAGDPSGRSTMGPAAELDRPSVLSEHFDRVTVGSACSLGFDLVRDSAARNMREHIFFRLLPTFPCDAFT